MAILAAATARHDFDFQHGTVDVDTTSAHLAPYANVGINVTGYDDIASRGECWLHFEQGSDIWVQFHLWSTTVALNATRTSYLFLLGDQDTEIGLFGLKWNGATGIDLMVWNGAAYTAVHSVTPSPFSNSTRYKIDVHVKMHDTDGIFRVYRDNTVVFEYLGDTLRTATTGMNRLWLRTPYTGDLTTCVHSGVIVADEDTRRMVFHQSDATANGANNDFSGTYTDVAAKTAWQVPPRSFRKGDTGDVQTFVMEDIDAALAAYNVRAVCLSARLRRALAGAQNAEFVVLDGTEYTEAMTAFDTRWAARRTVMHLNPIALTEWTHGSVATTEFGFKAVT